MRTIYLFKDEADFTRKISVDMAFLATYKKIRLPKIQFEDGLYLAVVNNGNNKKHLLSKGMIIKEDSDYFYFKFPFKPSEVENSAV